MHDLEHYYKTNKLEFYHLLTNIQNKNDLINDKIVELRNTPEIRTYINKVNLMTKLENIHECCVCYETKLNIPLLCFHEICIECYPKLTKCYLCNIAC
jgi:hypothetical protein